jgi:hypothetical protein
VKTIEFPGKAMLYVSYDEKKLNHVMKRVKDKEIIKFVYLIKNTRKVRKILRETSNTKR